MGLLTALLRPAILKNLVQLRAPLEIEPKSGRPGGDLDLPPELREQCLCLVREIESLPDDATRIVRLKFLIEIGSRERLADLRARKNAAKLLHYLEKYPAGGNKEAGRIALAVIGSGVAGRG